MSVSHDQRRFALQRTLPNDDGTKWKTMHRFKEADADVILNAADAMGRVGDPIFFRVVNDDDQQKALLHWTPMKGWS